MRPLRFRATRALGALPLLALLGCGSSDDRRPEARVVEVSRPDQDGSAKDAGTSEPDGGPDVEACEIIDGHTWSVPVDALSVDSSFSLVPGPIGFALAYRSSNGVANIGLMAIPEREGFAEPRALLPETGGYTIGDAALLPRQSACPAANALCKDARFQLAWVDNSTGSDEVHSVALSVDLQREVEAAARVSPEGGAVESKAKPVLAEVDGRVIAAWITRKHDAGDVIHARVLADGGGIVEVVASASDHKPRSLTMAPLGPETAGVAWATPSGSKRGIWLQRLGKDGRPRADAPVQLSPHVGPSSSVSIASHPSGGGVVYGVEIDGIKQVRYRRLSTTGELMGSEVPVVDSHAQSTGPSLYALGGGYAVVYRALPDTPSPQPQVRITFMPASGTIPTDAAGRLVSALIGHCELESDSRTAVAVSNQGEVMVAYLDSEKDQPSAKVLRVVRRLLDCSQSPKP